MKWKESKLSSYCDKVTVGYVGSMADKYVEDGIPFLRSQNIKPYFIDKSNLVFIDKAFHEKLSKSELRAGDVAIVRTGYPGTATVIPNDLGEANCSDLVIIRPSKELNSYFLAAIFNSTFGKSLVSGNLVGAAQQHFNVNVAKELKLRFPPRKEQDKIVAVFKAYDDLKECNRRKISVLENIVEELFREWFVRFRFPGYAIESSSPCKPGEHLKNRNYLPLDAMGSKQFLPIDHYGYEEAKSSLVTFEKGDFIFGAMRPYQHKVNIAPFKGITRTTCFVIRPKESYMYSYIYLTLFKQSTIDHAMLISNGSDRPYTVWNKGFERMNILKPTKQTLEAFEKKAKPILDQIISFYAIQRKLEQTKELLLPRLVSGKLEVKDLAIKFPPSMKELERK